MGILVFVVLEPIACVLLVGVACVSRFIRKRKDVGIGPLPLINSISHREVVRECGLSVETFTYKNWHITQDFDINFGRFWFAEIPFIGRAFANIFSICWALISYRVLVIYFNGLLQSRESWLIWRIEPLLLRIARIKTLVLAYGSDVQAMDRSFNLHFKHAMSRDYPNHRRYRKKITERIDLWSAAGDHVVAGCEWVDYMHHWDTLMLSHFAIDAPKAERNNCESDYGNVSNTRSFRVLHAPNHRAIKGTHFVQKAIDDLCEEGLKIELILVEGVSNLEVRAMLASCDLVVDQLVVGWYAMFAIEALSIGKPTICFLREDLVDLYSSVGLIAGRNEIPLIQASPMTIKTAIRKAYLDYDILQADEEGRKEFVAKHHSVAAIAQTLKPILKQLISES